MNEMGQGPVHPTSMIMGNLEAPILDHRKPQDPIEKLKACFICIKDPRLYLPYKTKDQGPALQDRIDAS